MLYWFFSLALFLSLAGGGAALLLLLTCKLADRAFPYRWRYRLWLLPVLLFVLPITVSLPVRPLSASVASPTPTAVEPAAVQPEQAQPPAGNTASVSAGEISVPEPGTPSVPELTHAESTTAPVPPSFADLKQLLPLVWLAGVLFLGVKYSAVQLRFRRFRRRATTAAQPWELALLNELRCSMGIRAQVNLRRFPGAGSPFLSGIVRPVIYLPETSLSQEALRQVLTHELIHCKRRDLLFKRAVCVVKVVHWFNPLAWLTEAELDRMCELSCDEAVTSGWDTGARRDYGLIVLALMRAPARRIPGSACLAEHEIKHRLEAIMNTKKQSIPRRVLSTLLVAVFCLSCTAFAVGVNGSNPAKARARTYQTEDFYYVTYLSKSPDVDTLDPYAEGAFMPGSGYTHSASGSAALTDTPWQKSFSATIQADTIFPEALNVTPADLPPAATYEVELTSLSRVIESRGEWVGAFTVKRDGAVIFDGEPGCLTHIPSLDGTQLTELSIGRDGQKFFYALINFGLDGLAPVNGYAASNRQTRTLLEHPDTHKIAAMQSKAAVIGDYPTEPYFHNEIYINDTLKQVSLDLTLMPQDLYTSRIGRTRNAFLFLELRPQDVTYYSGGAVKGRFYLAMPDFQDLEFDGTLTGLNGTPGQVITLRSDDGAYQLSFTIQTDRRGAELNPSTAEDHNYEGLSETQKAELIFHDTGEKENRTDFSTAELPFEVALTGDSVTLRYIGDPNYKTGATLRYTTLSDTGLHYKSIEQLVGGSPVTIPLPQDSLKLLELDLYQVTVENGTEMNRYTYSLIQGAGRAIAYDVRYYSFRNDAYSGDAAIGQLTGRDSGGVMAPAFLFHTP